MEEKGWILREKHTKNERAYTENAISEAIISMSKRNF